MVNGSTQLPMVIHMCTIPKQGEMRENSNISRGKEHEVKVLSEKLLAVVDCESQVVL